MKLHFFKVFLVLAVVAIYVIPTTNLVSAHEVYVLGSAEVSSILATPSENPFSALSGSQFDFFLWSFIGAMLVTVVFFVSILRPVEKFFDPMLFTLKRKYGFIIVRITIGLALFASGYYQSLFGPEISLTKMFGEYTTFASYVLMALGLCITIGLFTRLAGLSALAFAIYAVFVYGWYILTYSNYIGDIVFVAILGAHIWSIDKHVFHWHGVMLIIERWLEHYAFLVLRVTFGLSLIYASVYAKFIYSNLALQTVIDYNLTDYFNFPPLFIVLGAGLVEITLGIFFIIGFEVRFAALFLMVFLTMSLLYFGESVWPHIVLFGGALALFVHGYDKYTVEGYFFKDAKREPVL